MLRRDCASAQSRMRTLAARKDKGMYIGEGPSKILSTLPDKLEARETVIIYQLWGGLVEFSHI